MTNIFLIIALWIITSNLQAQLLENSLFKIYRAEFISGTVTQLRLNSDNTYQIKIIEIHCSLCDHRELKQKIDSKGNWSQINDTIFIESKKKMLLIGDSIIKPLYAIGLNTDSIPDDKAITYQKKIIEGNMQDFHLVYDTYPDGVAKMIKDTHRMRRDEYKIELDSKGTIKSVEYYWDNKRKKRIK